MRTQLGRLKEKLDAVQEEKLATVTPELGTLPRAHVANS